MANTGLAGRVVMVTGAAGGIGRALCSAFAEENALVAACDLNAEGAEAVAKELRELGVQAIGQQIDVANGDSVRAGVAAITAELGPIDVLVNNAGIDKIEPFVESTEETWRRIIDVNLIGSITCAREVLDSMIDLGRGRIITISSDAGRVGSSGEVVYSGTKGGVIAFSKALARETARKGITVNCVCPGPTDTSLLNQIAERSQKMYDGLARAVPIGRIGQPEDIAPAVVFLAGDGASYITGQTLSVSGGLTMS